MLTQAVPDLLRWMVTLLCRQERCLTRERIAEPTHKKQRRFLRTRTPIAQGFREKKEATGGVIIVREHIAKMWEASQSKPKGQSS
jgi:hypothetical protein